MTDLAITAANVKAESNATVDRGQTAGATITAGQVVYEDATTGKLGLADNNAATPPEAKLPIGIALNGASDGQPIAIARGGDVTIGATLIPGTDYFLGDAPGAISPRADITSGETVTLVGLAISATVLRINIAPTGVTL